MNRHSIRATLFLALACGAGAALVAACSDERRTFDETPRGIAPDASIDGSGCAYECSLDGRAIIDTCTGAIVETCASDLACGAGTCQEPCAAAAADRSSNGCEFYLQPPRFDKRLAQSCYASYIVNTSTVPVDVALSLAGEELDVSKAIFKLQAGTDWKWTPQVGPIDPGEAVVLFVSDAPRGRPEYGEAYTPCPDDAVPGTYRDPLPDGSGLGTSFHLTTTAPVSLAAIYPYSGGQSYVTSATLLLPVATWGKEHMIVNAWEQVTNPVDATGGGPAAQIVAAEDDTEVTIVPTRSIQDGQGVTGSAPNLPVTYRLSKGQVLQINQQQELSGSIVQSNKPTSIFGGHECMYVPSNRSACDVAQQQLPSFEQWGSEYVGVGYRPRLGDEHEPVPYRIVAARDGTRLDYDPVVPPGAPLEMSAGQVVTFWSGTGDAFVVRSQDAEHPFYLAAYMTGGGSKGDWAGDFLGDQDMRGKGDPEFVNVVPAGQYLSSYGFFADPTYQETALTIVREKRGDAFEDVWLECAGILTDWRPIGTRGKYEFTRVDLARNYGPGQSFGESVCQKGLQRMKSDGPFTATLWGWSQYTSYAYPSGQAQRKLVDSPLVIVN